MYGGIRVLTLSAPGCFCLIMPQGGRGDMKLGTTRLCNVRESSRNFFSKTAAIEMMTSLIMSIFLKNCSIND